MAARLNIFFYDKSNYRDSRRRPYKIVLIITEYQGRKTRNNEQENPKLTVNLGKNDITKNLWTKKKRNKDRKERQIKN